MTRLFGVIGHPIAHSLSPAMHTAALEALRLEACYGAFDVPPRFLRPMLRALVLSGVEGLNVTVPLKESVVPLMDRLDAAARATGAVNTIVIRGRRMAGHNTDAAGFRRALIEAAGGIRGQRVLLLGAGGAGRAVGWALAGMGPSAIRIANRSPGKADRLARRFRKESAARIGAVAWRAPELKRAVREADVVVNATTVGMRPRDGSPVDPAWLRPGTRVYDLIYHRTTPLIRGARRRGCVASGGLSMLVYQGAESLRLWTGRTPPIEVMRQALSKALI
jgi:shikimate dehydrogenase